VYRLVESTPAAARVRSAAPAKTPAAVARQPSPGLIDIVLVGCAKKKVETPSPARLLYRSALFDKRRSYAQTRARTWYVLSAEHGLVHPDALLEPYDVALADAAEEYRRAWGQWVVAKLAQVEGDLRGRQIEIHAGQPYAAPLLPLLRAAGAEVVHPFTGLRRGEQLAWYNSPPAPPPGLAPAPGPAPRSAQSPARAGESTSEDEPVDGWLSNVTLIDGPRPAQGFTYRWPQDSETFESSTELTLAVAGASHRLRVAVCDRQAYGRSRRRIVVFTGSQPLAEAVGVDNYEHSRALAGLLKDSDGRMILPGAPIPQVYEGFPLVVFSEEVTGPYSRAGLAVRLREDDLVSWGTFALARTAVRSNKPPAASAPAAPPVTVQVPAQRGGGEQAIVTALLRFGREHQQERERIGAEPQFTPHPQANRLLIDDPFAFLLAVIFDQGIGAERAWRAPYELRLRLGHLDPVRIAADFETVRAAVARRPCLHRYIEKMPRWLVAAAGRVITGYDGDAAAIWSDQPRAADLAARLRRFDGISQKKSAMAVEILARDLGVPVRELTGSDIAYDVHVRRVFLRTGLATVDDPDHMIDVARRLHPQRPGELDFPAWLIGRQWCAAGTPDCPGCPLAAVCPRDILRAGGVYGA
jgi:uncharacterized HhH-GPD family protein